MENKNRGGDSQPPNLLEHGKDNHFELQFKTVYNSFKERPKTTLEVAIETGVLRNCITWHVAEMEARGLIQVVKKALDPFTRFKAGFYSTDETLFTIPDASQLNLFDNGI